MQSNEESLFRKIASEGQLLTQKQVEECLEIQRQSPNRKSLFGIMIEKGYINDSNMGAIVAMTPSSPQPVEIEETQKRIKRFGELCVEKGLVTSAQIDECLKFQNDLDAKGKHIRIGQILIEKKYVDIRKAQMILELQGKKILRCLKCETKYNIRNYKLEKKYQCPKCGNELASSERKDKDVAVSDNSIMNVERSFSSRDSVDVDDEALSLLHKKVGDYEIVELLGEGGMADVYKVISSKHKKARALKVMKSQAGVQRFNREFESAHSLRHPNIVRVYDTGKIENRSYFFMEYLDGGTLAKYIEKMGVLSVKDSLNILKQVAMGLNYAHENSIIHRDIKTSNILLTRSPNREIISKITDFGIARAPSSNQITVTGQLVGTFKYMAPEHIKGENLDGRADIFSLGIVAYEMLTGREPFTVDSPIGYLFVNVRETPPMVHQINSDIPKAVSLLVAQMMAKSQKERYDAPALLRDLDRLNTHLSKGEWIHEEEDATSIFYEKGAVAKIKGLWNRFFVSKKFDEESSPKLSSTEPGKLTSGTIISQSMETEEVNKDAAAQKQYEFAQELVHQNNIDGAKKYLTALIEVFPASVWAARAKRQLLKLDSQDENKKELKAAKKKFLA